MPEVMIKIEPNMPEHLDVTYVTIDWENGQPAKYERTTVTMGLDKGFDNVTVFDQDGTPHELPDAVRFMFTTTGNWESDGVAKAFIELGQTLLKHNSN